MSKNYGSSTTSEVNNKVGPDFFGFYTSEVKELLSRDEDEGLVPFSHSISHVAGNQLDEGREKCLTKNIKIEENNGINRCTSLFSNGIGALLSESKKERLKYVLRQSVFTLTKEVDEMIDPVLSIYRIRSCLKCKDHLLSADASTCKVDQPQPNKKLKRDRSLKNVRPMNSDTKDGQECAVIDEDLRFLLESDTTKVEELVKNHSDEFYDTLHHMEQKLEELLNIVMTSCRPMTLVEKQQLRRLVQNLSPRNLDRVVEIIGHNKPPSEKYSCDEVHVDLDGMDNVTLWRLYFYVTNPALFESTKSAGI